MAMIGDLFRCEIYSVCATNSHGRKPPAHASPVIMLVLMHSILRADIFGIQTNRCKISMVSSISAQIQRIISFLVCELSVFDSTYRVRQSRKHMFVAH